MRFKTGDVIAERPTWWLYGSDNELLAWAGDTFPSMQVAEDAAELFRSGASRAKFELYQDRLQRWRWRAWVSDTKVASSSDAYLSALAARRAANSVRALVATATPSLGAAAALRSQAG